MTTMTAHTWHVPSFDGLIEELEQRATSFTEEDALKSSHWNQGEDARLREDARFRLTPWGRWVLASHLLANDALYRKLQEGRHAIFPLVKLLKESAQEVGCPVVFCSGDKRFVLTGDNVRLASSELTADPLPEDISEMEKYAA